MQLTAGFRKMQRLRKRVYWGHLGKMAVTYWMLLAAYWITAIASWVTSFPGWVHWIFVIPMVPLLIAIVWCSFPAPDFEERSS